MLDVTRLRVLVAVARTGSVTAAARELGYAQPSVSHHLARLEAESGARLLQRAGRGIRLTEAGRRLAERGEEILGRIDAAEVELAALTGLRQGRVRLAAFPSALGTFVPPAAARLAAVHPGLQVRLSEAEPPEALDMLRDGRVEVAVIFQYGGETTDEDVRTQVLFEEPSYLVSRAPGTADLAAHAEGPWIAGCARCRRHLLDLCAAAGFEPQISFTTDDYVAVQSLVVAGLGTALLPGLALRAVRHPGVHTVTVPGSTRRILAATYGAPPDPPATAALLAALAEAAAAG